MYRTIKRLSSVLIAFLLFQAFGAYSLPEDNKQKIYIIADSTTYNYKNGTNIFEGHVKVDQGATHITADKLVTTSNEQHQMTEAIAYGIQELAHYWTQPKVGEELMHARAKVIKFYPIESNITLEQDVHVTQGENSFQGELIHYNSSEQTITVPPSSRGRAVLVYNPDKK